METEDYINEIKKKIDFEQIEKHIKKLEELNVLIIGDSIIDQYTFVSPKGRAIKDPILSTEYNYEESYIGGALAIANNISNFVKKVKVITLIGDKESKLDFIKKNINENVELKTFIKKNAPTIVKKRYVDSYRNNKLFKVEYINDMPISKDLTEEILNYLDKELSIYDLVVVGDFGHGFINESIRKKLEEKFKFLVVNVQTNSTNLGYNYFSLYKKINFICMNESEMRLPMRRRFEEIEDVIKEVYTLFKYENFLVTLGKKGCIFINNGNLFKAPVLITSVKDTVGAGDALFAITSLWIYLKADNEIIPFIANCVGGIAANIMGNKEGITKDKLLNFIKETIK